MSTPPSQSQLMENLAGVVDIMRGRTSGRNRIDLTANGIVWSFAGLAIAGLIDLSALSILYESGARNAEQVSKAFFMIGHLIVALFGYGASLMALFLLCRTPSEQQNFPVAIAVHNWAAPVVSLAFLPLLMLASWLGGGSPSGENGLLNLISVFWIGVLIFVGIRIMRISLDIYTSKAAIYFIVTTVVSILTTETLESLIGLVNR